MAQRPPHYLDESLSAALDLSCDLLPSEVARVLINLCGAVRSLERQNDDLRQRLTAAQQQEHHQGKASNHQQQPARVEGAA